MSTPIAVRGDQRRRSTNHAIGIAGAAADAACNRTMATFVGSVVLMFGSERR
jgi:hypothetical protein